MAQYRTLNQHFASFVILWRHVSDLNGGCLLKNIFCQLNVPCTVDICLKFSSSTLVQYDHVIPPRKYMIGRGGLNS